MPSRADPAAAITKLSHEGARLLQANRAEEAGKPLRAALAKSEEAFGELHATTADCLNNLGEWHRLTEQGEEAEQCYRRSLAIREQLDGPDSPAGGPALNSLALLLRKTGRLDEAEACYRRALDLCARTHAPDDLHVAGVVNNLAQVLARTGRPAEAEPLMRRAVGILEAKLGARHPNVALALNNLARLLAGRGRLREAEFPARRQVEIFEEIYRATGEQPAPQMSARKLYYDLLVSGLDFRSRTAHVRLRTLVEGRDPGELPVADPAPAERPDFDALSRAANAPGAAVAAKAELYAAAFRLEEWLFIARGTFPDVRPYVAANRALVDGVPMLKAFTDADRLHLFASDNALTAPDGGALVLSLPVASIQPILDSLADQGVTHVHFNADDCSEGFYAPLRQLPAIRQHLVREGLL